jgi:hypothetical protein
MGRQEFSGPGIRWGHSRNNTWQKRILRGDHMTAKKLLILLFAICLLFFLLGYYLWEHMDHTSNIVR